MIVTIWRHGEAGRAATDKQRELTGRGRDDIGFACRQFQSALEMRAIEPPALILYSPWIRTAQTAEIIASAFPQAHCREDASLRSGASVAAVEHCLNNVHSAADAPPHVLLVSHQPLVSQLVDFYLGTASNVPPLNPGALVTLSLEVPACDCGELVFWAVPPEYEAGV